MAHYRWLPGEVWRLSVTDALSAMDGAYRRIVIEAELLAAVVAGPLMREDGGANVRQMLDYLLRAGEPPPTMADELGQEVADDYAEFAKRARAWLEKRRAVEE